MDLLEREPSLALLAGYAAEARRGDGRLVLVGGEAGVGKTALLERFHRDLPDARWFWGACDGLFTPRPLGPLYDLADQFGGERAEPQRRRGEGRRTRPGQLKHRLPKQRLIRSAAPRSRTGPGGRPGPARRAAP
jgi:predicted ATPase